MYDIAIKVVHSGFLSRHRDERHRHFITVNHLELAECQEARHSFLLLLVNLSSSFILPFNPTTKSTSISHLLSKTCKLPRTLSRCWLQLVKAQNAQLRTEHES